MQQCENQLTKDFQEILNHAGLPGFCATEERNQLKIQRHLIKLIQLLGQERKQGVLYPSLFKTT